MAMVNFKKGLRAGLPATYAEGTFYVTTDERAIYLDVSDSARIRLGDFQEFASVAALEANANPSTTALYFVSDINCLAKWDGSQYVQINRDTGVTSVEVVGEGNAVTAAVYSADGRKLTLTKGATYMTAADVDGKIAAATGDMTGYANVKAYVDKKTEGIATDAALGELQGKVTTAEGKIAELEAANKEGGSVATAIAGAQATADQAVEDAAAAKAAADAAQETADSKVTMAQVEAKDYATKAEAQGYANAKDNAIAEAKAAGDAAQEAVDALAGKVGTVPADKTVVQMIADAQAEATYDDTALAGRVTTVEGKVAAIEEDYLVEADKTELAEAIADEQERAEGVESGLAARIKVVEDDYLKAADREALQDQIDLIMNNPDTENVINSINEFTQYVKDHGTIAEGFRTDIDKNKEDIAANAKAIADQATADEAKYETKTDAASKLTEAKEHATGLNTAMDTRVKVLEAINHDAYKAADETVLSAAKEHANGLDKAMDERVKVLEAIDHEAYKGYADGLNEAMDGRMDVVEAAIERIDGEIDGHDEKIAALEAVGATKVEKSNTNGNIKIDGVETVVYTHPATHAISEVSGLQGALDLKLEAADIADKADKATTLAGYGIADAYTKDEVVEMLSWSSF